MKFTKNEILWLCGFLRMEEENEHSHSKEEMKEIKRLRIKLKEVLK